MRDQHAIPHTFLFLYTPMITNIITNWDKIYGGDTLSLIT